MNKKVALGLGLLFVGLGLALPSYGNLVTNTEESTVASSQAVAAQRAKLPASAEQTSTGKSSSAITAKAKLKEGALIAKIRIPRFGKAYYRGIYEGTSVPRVLNKLGIGHYVGTELPGELGNFAIAGHRFGSGGPFLKIDKFKAGDLITVETAKATFTYKYLQTKIVLPSAVGVVDFVPKGLVDPEKNGHYLTLTSCTPVHVNTHRIIAWFSLQETVPKA